MCGNPASGKSNGFTKSVNDPSAAISRLLKYNPTTHDLSQSALLAELKAQHDEDRGFLVIGKIAFSKFINFF